MGSGGGRREGRKERGKEKDRKGAGREEGRKGREREGREEGKGREGRLMIKQILVTINFFSVQQLIGCGRKLLISFSDYF